MADDDVHADQPGAHVVQVRINARLQHVQRGDRYEDPLAFFLESRFPGSRVTSGGTLRTPEGEPLLCGIDAEVVGDLDEILGAVIAFLEEHGSPRGSTVSVLGGDQRSFGTLEGLALYLNGTELSPEVYESFDVNELLDQVAGHIDGIGSLQSFWEAPHTTAAYLYGPSADAMRTAIAPLLATHPLASRSRLLQIA